MVPVVGIFSNQDIIEEFIQARTFIYPNGIALSADGRKLFVAHFGGISAIDMESRKVADVTCPDNSTIAGIDGLYHHKNYLLAVQNGVSPQRIIKMHLNPSQTRITNLEVLESNHPLFENIPTTGTIAGNDFYYIANSQLRSLNNKGAIISPEQLVESVILKLKL